MLSLVEKTRLSGPYTAGSWRARGGAQRLRAALGSLALLLQVEGASHRLSVRLDVRVSAELLHLLGLSQEAPRTPSGPRRLRPRCRQAGAWPPVKAWPPRAGTAALLPVPRSARPGASLLPRGPLPPFLCYTFRVDNWASVCNRWQQTEQEKAFITLQPAVTTAWIDGCNQPTASVLSGSSPGALPCHLRTEGIVTLPPARAQLGRGSQPHSSD